MLKYSSKILRSEQQGALSLIKHSHAEAWPAGSTQSAMYAKVSVKVPAHTPDNAAQQEVVNIEKGA